MTRVVINGESLYSSSSHRLRAGVPPNVTTVPPAMYVMSPVEVYAIVWRALSLLE